MLRSICIPFWQILALSLSLPIVTAVGFIGVLSFRNSHRELQQLAFDRMTQRSEQIQEYFDAYLEDARHINQGNVYSVRYGDLDLQDLPTLEKRLFGELQQFKSISTVFFVSPEGILRGAGRESGKPVIITADYNEAIAFLSYRVDDYGNRLHIDKYVPNIDVRRDRPWYKLAVATGKPGWTPVFQLANFNILTINAFHPLYDEADGKLLGVFSVNISLEQISQFLRSHKQDPQAALFVLDAEGYLIGSTSDVVPFTTEQNQGKTQFKRMRPKDSSNPVIRATEQYLNSHDPNWARHHTAQQLEFRGEDDTYYVQTHPYHQDNDLNWLVVEVIPESSLMGSVIVNTYQTIFVCSLFFGVSIIGAIIIAHWITKPLERLHIEAQRIPQDDFQAVVLNSPITEIRSLTSSFNQTAQQLSLSFAAMRSLNEQLQAKEILLQEALTQSEAQFKEAFDTAAIGMGILSITGQFLRVNPSLCEMFDYAAADFLKLNFQDIDKSENNQSELKLRQQLLNNEIPYYHLEQRFHRLDGELIWGLVSMALVRDSQNNPLYFVLQIQDISSQKKAELELQELTRIDPLTQIFNRRWFAQQLEQEWRRAQREKLPLSVIMLDVDFFKQYNDHYGHPAGDRCLVEIAQILKWVIQRPVDLVARYGGEEFVIILANTPRAGAIVIAQKIKEALADLAIPHEHSTVSNQITVSQGIATIIPNPKTTIDCIISTADQALYCAKQHGRNCFIAS